MPWANRRADRRWAVPRRSRGDPAGRGWRTRLVHTGWRWRGPTALIRPGAPPHCVRRWRWRSASASRWHWQVSRAGVVGVVAGRGAGRLGPVGGSRLDRGAGRRTVAARRGASAVLWLVAGVGGVWLETAERAGSSPLRVSVDEFTGTWSQRPGDLIGVVCRSRRGVGFGAAHRPDGCPRRRRRGCCRRRCGRDGGRRAREQSSNRPCPGGRARGRGGVVVRHAGRPGGDSAWPGRVGGALPRFSTVALPVVMLLTASGVAAAVVNLEVFGAHGFSVLWGSGCNRILVAKTAALTALVSLASAHRRRWVPQSSRAPHCRGRIGAQRHRRDCDDGGGTGPGGRVGRHGARLTDRGQVERSTGSPSTTMSPTGSAGRVSSQALLSSVKIVRAKPRPPRWDSLGISKSLALGSSATMCSPCENGMMVLVAVPPPDGRLDVGDAESPLLREDDRVGERRLHAA